MTSLVDVYQVLLALQASLSSEEVKQEVTERLADAAADLWPTGPPLPEELSDEELLQVVEQALSEFTS